MCGRDLINFLSNMHISAGEPLPPAEVKVTESLHSKDVSLNSRTVRSPSPPNTPVSEPLPPPRNDESPSGSSESSSVFNNLSSESSHSIHTSDRYVDSPAKLYEEEDEDSDEDVITPYKNKSDNSMAQDSKSGNGTFDLSVTGIDKGLRDQSNETVEKRNLDSPPFIRMTFEKPKRRYPHREEILMNSIPTKKVEMHSADITLDPEDYNSPHEFEADSDSEIASQELYETNYEDDSYLIEEDDDDDMADQLENYDEIIRASKLKLRSSDPDRISVEELIQPRSSSYDPEVVLTQKKNSSSQRDRTAVLETATKSPRSSRSSSPKSSRSPAYQKEIVKELSSRADNIDPLEVAIEVFDSATTLANEGNLDDAIPLYLHVRSLQPIPSDDYHRH